MLARTQTHWEMISFGLVILIHAVFLLSDSPLPTEWTDALGLALYPLGGLHILCSFLRLISIASSRGPLWLGESLEAGPADTVRGWDDVGKDDSNQLADVDSLADGGESCIPTCSSQPEIPDETTASGALLGVIAPALLTADAVPSLLYLVLSALALATGWWQILAYHLLYDLVRTNTLLQQTLSAVQAYAGSLVAVGLLFFALIYVFALIG